MLKIDCYIAEMCGSYYQLRDALHTAIADLGIVAQVDFHTVYYDDAVAKDIKGSPSIWINGKDAFEGGNSPGIS